MVALAAAGCALPGEEEDLDVGSTRQAAVVSDFYGSTCSTEVVLGLSRQIADEVMCIKPDTFVTFEEGNGIVFSGGAVLPYTTPKGKEDLLAAVAAHGGELRINSAFRTVAQQYLLRVWFERGRCDITAAAPPGTSNHESGRAIDVANWPDWVGALGNKGWGHTVPGDDVHFDHLSSPDLRGFDVLAFQRLWNRNHADDQIDEDGSYGPQTGERLARAPADGFEVGACAGDEAAEPYAGALVSLDAPPVMAPGERAQISVAVRNTGEETWTPGGTFIATTGEDRASAFYDAETWPSPSRAATVAADTAPGEVGMFEFMALAPPEDEIVVHESFRLSQDGAASFAPVGIEVEVLVSATEDAEEGGLVGGCAAGGGSGGAWLALLALSCVLGRGGRRVPARPRRRR
ncbi:MAG TPA: D-alanyl-D-alanine carboxypeptidase family protein [Kofleriaceae bacterium]|nr:D-alanyl-D-alanine carboxypeptidase family protein [Kofleriaceae bacterium]